MSLPLLDPSRFSHCLTPRAPDSHKGDHGSLGILGGAPGMGGALLLAARSALFAGTGRVFAGFVDSQAPRLDPLHPELMIRPPLDLFSLPLTALAIGPGLGLCKLAKRLLEEALASSLPLVIDADGLNLLSAHRVLWNTVSRRTAPTLLTPHPAEAARLLQTTVAEVQANRAETSWRLHEHTGASVVLKGQHSVLTLPDGAGTWCQMINPSGNPGLAAAGMGDVLTGLIGALLAQGKPSDEALGCAVYVHGLAADQLLAQGHGPIGLTASEVALQARQVLNGLVADGQENADLDP